MTITRTLIAVAVAVLALPACTEIIELYPDHVAPDARPPPDAAPPPDAVVSLDAALPPDAQPSVDAAP